MNFTWRQVILCSTAALAAGYLGYRYYSSSASTTTAKGKKKANEQEESTNTADKAKAESTDATKKKTSVKPKKPKTKTEPTPTMPTGFPEELAETMGKCELPVTELLKLSTEEKQRVFYALLTKGEFVLNQGVIPTALEYFSKAIAIVPNPGEVVAAFEKMLPPPIFNSLLDKIQVELQARVGDYFKGITPKNGKVVFKEVIVEEDGSGRPRKDFSIFASKAITVGETIWEEVADIASPVINLVTDDNQNICEWCMRSNLEDTKIIVCGACKESKYCSEQCREKSANSFHPFFCKADEVVDAALDELYDLCRETRSSLPILMLRYIAMLLSEELRGNGVSSNGPFTHYDHLRPLFLAPNDFDKKEAKLLRRIFSSTNKEVVEFLSDDIYASMKNTLARHCLVLGPEEKESFDQSDIIHMESRTLQYLPTSIAFFHISAHLNHSCDPNLAMIPIDARNVRIVALKNIKAGDLLNISFLPFPEYSTTLVRRTHLSTKFGFDCKCNLCEANSNSN